MRLLWVHGSPGNGCWSYGLGSLNGNGDGNLLESRDGSGPLVFGLNPEVDVEVIE